MRISMKGRYGLKAMILLSIFSKENHVPIYIIADKMNISDSYLEQIFSILRKCGYIRSVKGAQGGYTLTVDPKHITVGAILRALEGDLMIIDDYDEKMEEKENATAYCIKICVWNKVNESIQLTVDSLTLADLIERYNTLTLNHLLMYYI